MKTFTKIKKINNIYIKSETCKIVSLFNFVVKYKWQSCKIQAMAHHKRKIKFSIFCNKTILKIIDIFLSICNKILLAFYKKIVAFFIINKYNDYR